MSSTFEFLSSEEEWEKECLDNSQVDSRPKGFRGQTETFWTYPAQFLATLKVYGKQMGLALSTVAQNGKASQNSDKESKIGGYPGLVARCSTESRDLQVWRKYSDPRPETLDRLPEGCVLLRFDVTLLSPFFSRDDLSFYPIDNALKRHKVFDVPFLAASGIKGLLRWASRMRRGSLEDDDKDLFLFGTVRNNISASGDPQNGASALAGALICYPFFFSGGSLGLEVINPQDRKTGAGSVPVKYEVVQPGATGTFFFLLPNLPGRCRLSSDHVSSLIDDLKFLCTQGGISAKSSTGWGALKLDHAAYCIRAAREKMPEDETEFPRKQPEAALTTASSPSGKLLVLPSKEAFEAAREAATDSSGNLLNPYKKKKKGKSTEPDYQILGFHPGGWKPRNKKEKEAEFSELNKRWPHLRRPKSYEEVRSWLEEENARIEKQAASDAADAAQKQAERDRKAEEERQAAAERKRRDWEERHKTKWSINFSDFDSLKQALQQVMGERRQKA